VEERSDDLDYLKAHVPEFEGYVDEIARHHTDQRVRAWVGSTLADVQARLAGKLDPQAQKALETAIFRCQFPDQVFTTRLDVAQVDSELEQGLAQTDRQLVELALRAKDAKSTELPAILSELMATFDRRRQRAPAQPPVV
jgi:hypothetical protein